MRSITWLVVLALGIASSTAVAAGQAPGWLRRLLPGYEPYALDDVPRYLAEGEPIACDPGSLVAHRGETVRFRSTVRVHPEFKTRLLALERIAHDVGVEVYGRAPRRIRHAGTFNCRLVRGRRRRISEHALGNAIDIKAFEFGPLRRAARADAPEDLPRRLTRGFVVTVARHWEDDGAHGRFLRALTDRLWEERVFRGMIGPSHPRHENHLHFEMGPWRFNWL